MLVLFQILLPLELMGAQGDTERVNVDSSGNQGDSDSYNPSISGDGRYVAFESSASNLVANDTNGVTDIFVHQLLEDQPTSIPTYTEWGMIVFVTLSLIGAVYYLRKKIIV